MLLSISWTRRTHLLRLHHLENLPELRVLSSPDDDALRIRNPGSEPPSEQEKVEARSKVVLVPWLCRSEPVSP